MLVNIGPTNRELLWIPNPVIGWGVRITCEIGELRSPRPDECVRAYVG